MRYKYFNVEPSQPGALCHAIVKILKILFSSFVARLFLSWVGPLQGTPFNTCSTRCLFNSPSVVVKPDGRGRSRLHCFYIARFPPYLACSRSCVESVGEKYTRREVFSPLAKASQRNFYLMSHSVGGAHRCSKSRLARGGNGNLLVGIFFKCSLSRNKFYGIKRWWNFLWNVLTT